MFRQGLLIYLVISLVVLLCACNGGESKAPTAAASIELNAGYSAPQEEVVVINPNIPPEGFYKGTWKLADYKGLFKDEPAYGLADDHGLMMLAVEKEYGLLVANFGNEPLSDNSINEPVIFNTCSSKPGYKCNSKLSLLALGRRPTTALMKNITFKDSDHFEANMLIDFHGFTGTKKPKMSLETAHGAADMSGHIKFEPFLTSQVSAPLTLLSLVGKYTKSGYDFGFSEDEVQTINVEIDATGALSGRFVNSDNTCDFKAMLSLKRRSSKVFTVSDFINTCTENDAPLKSVTTSKLAGMAYLNQENGVRDLVLMVSSSEVAYALLVPKS